MLVRYNKTLICENCTTTSCLKVNEEYYALTFNNKLGKIETPILCKEEWRFRLINYKEGVRRLESKGSSLDNLDKSNII